MLSVGQSYCVCVTRAPNMVVENRQFSDVKVVYDGNSKRLLLMSCIWT